MNNTELRSALHGFLEKSLEQDRKLTEALADVADQAGPNQLLFDYASVHMKHLTEREKLVKELLRVLVVEPPSPENEMNRILPTLAETVQIKPSLDDPFAEELVRVYNTEPAKWARQFHPSSFGAANVDEIWRNGGSPKFTRKEGGIYQLIQDGNRYYVVPELGLRLREGYWRSEGVAYLFDAPQLEPSGNGSLVWLVSPALVEESGDRWSVTQKGEIRERG